MKPITDEAATARLGYSGLTLEDTLTMTDSQLLALPSIGRRTLAWIRAKAPVPVARQDLDTILAAIREGAQDEGDALHKILTATAERLAKLAAKDGIAQAAKEGYETTEEEEAFGAVAQVVVAAFEGGASAFGLDVHHRDADALIETVGNSRTLEG